MDRRTIIAICFCAIVVTVSIFISYQIGYNSAESKAYKLGYVNGQVVGSGGAVARQIQAANETGWWQGYNAGLNARSNGTG